MEGREKPDAIMEGRFGRLENEMGGTKWTAWTHW
jgi:hypothetical protein